MITGWTGSAGSATLPYVYVTSDNLSWPSGGSGQKLIFSTIQDQIAPALFTINPNNQFVAIKAGVYLFCAVVGTTTTVTGTYTVSFRKIVSGVTTTIARNVGPSPIAPTLMIYLQVNDIIEIYLFQTSGSTLTIQGGIGNTRCCCRFLG